MALEPSNLLCQDDNYTAIKKNISQQSCGPMGAAKHSEGTKRTTMTSSIANRYISSPVETETETDLGIGKDFGSSFFSELVPLIFFWLAAT